MTMTIAKRDSALQIINNEHKHMPSKPSKIEKNIHTIIIITNLTRFIKNQSF